ncbi:DnaQ-like DNA polymerase III subunit [Mycobacterium phage AvadaKedavra]|uniref:DnaQ-like DNA polymerase III subunit n=2 Tax=Bronvirus TaxID=1623278 RepID=A0A514U567_9CAUD|nr:DNA polymerase exonuclease subunit [Mycobacterium phage Silverleaf]QBP29177.1 DnaQ-like DNA polymerase III subunit [Mycobacterium phage Silverleaf]QDK04097.1 DnaQ-like DNA polymerase III subunit [Mycobacterium phage AvadaKedavra]
MSARVLVLDIETQRAIVEVFDLFRPWIGIDQVRVPKRVLCFAAKWRGEDKVIFKAAWDDNDEDAYRRMMQAAWELLDSADIVVTWNGDRFDMQWLEAEFLRLGMPRPMPYKSVDLIKTAKRWFKGGLMSLKLDWSSRIILKDRKVNHGGNDLWWDIRHGTRAEKRAAQKTMREYNEHDVVLTARLFEKYLPYLNVNLALYGGHDDDVMRCVKCESENLKKDGVKAYVTNAGVYQMYRCKDCGATSRGKRIRATTELRPV